MGVSDRSYMLTERDIATIESGQPITILGRRFIPDPKPVEPEGLGAVVEDAEGRRWVRFRINPEPWRRGDAGIYRAWSLIHATRVLSSGVES